MSPQSVLDTPELLCRIIELANPAVQVAAAQTCREWNKHAIGTIWGKLSSFIPLLELLAPLQHDGTAWEYGSDAVIKFENWERLQFYGQNVRSILHDDGKRFKNDNGNVRSRTYLTLAAVVANRASFLPNLHTLEWTISQASSIPALGVIASPSIKHIKLIIKSDIDSSRVLNTLLGRMGDLITVDICLPFDTTVQTAEDSLSRFLREQPKLSNLRLPPFFVSEKIVASLSGMKLRRLEQPDRGNRRSQHNPLGSQLCFDSEAFSTLTSLDCDMDMTKANT
ncbi:hypothetical protein FRC02_009045 [Tulasnella sp. 418]|nr:hypothetical protein FRC02_009045 [Tulasnella sp. 418]